MKDINSIFAQGIFAQGYGFSPKLVMKDKNLTIEAKAIYAYLASYSGAGLSSFPSSDLICHELGITRQRYAKHRALLIEFGYLKVTQERGEKGFNKNIFELIVNPENVGLGFVTTGNVTTENVTTENHTYNSNNLKSNNLKSNNANKSMSGKPDNTPTNDVAKQIIEYLNLKAGTAYMPKAKSNIALVNARIKDGATIEQLRAVIDRKCAEWLGTKMSEYLRPATLFGATKFNQYVGQLNTPLPNKNNGNSGNDNNDPWADAYF